MNCQAWPKEDSIELFMIRDEMFGDTATGVNSVYQLIQEMKGVETATSMLASIQANKQ